MSSSISSTITTNACHQQLQFAKDFLVSEKHKDCNWKMLGEQLQYALEQLVVNATKMKCEIPVASVDLEYNNEDGMVDLNLILHDHPVRIIGDQLVPLFDFKIYIPDKAHLSPDKNWMIYFGRCISHMVGTYKQCNKNEPHIRVSVYLHKDNEMQELVIHVETDANPTVQKESKGKSDSLVVTDGQVESAASSKSSVTKASSASTSSTTVTKSSSIPYKYPPFAVPYNKSRVEMFIADQNKYAHEVSNAQDMLGVLTIDERGEAESAEAKSTKESSTPHEDEPKVDSCESSMLADSSSSSSVHTIQEANRSLHSILPPLGGTEIADRANVFIADRRQAVKAMMDAIIVGDNRTKSDSNETTTTTESSPLRITYSDTDSVMFTTRDDTSPPPLEKAQCYITADALKCWGKACTVAHDHVAVALTTLANDLLNEWREDPVDNPVVQVKIMPMKADRKLDISVWYIPSALVRSNPDEEKEVYSTGYTIVFPGTILDSDAGIETFTQKLQSMLQSLLTSYIQVQSCETQVRVQLCHVLDNNTFRLQMHLDQDRNSLNPKCIAEWKHQLRVKRNALTDDRELRKFTAQLHSMLEETLDMCTNHRMQPVLLDVRAQQDIQHDSVTFQTHVYTK